MSRVEGFYNVSIHPRALKMSWEPYDRRPRTGYRSTFNISTKRNRPDGLISRKAQGRINTAIDWLLAQSTTKKVYDKKTKKHFNFRVNFLTLTLCASQIHDDNTIKQKLLNTMLVHLRQKWGVKYYLWRAEAQANGNIHFHIACDTYIPWWELRHYWNKVQNNLGYIDRFEEKHGHRDPNSTDIHSVKRIRNLGGYLAKEIAKNSNGSMYTALKLQNKKLVPCYNPSEQISVPDRDEKMYRSIGGNLWNLSSALSQIKATVLVIADKVRDEITAIKKAFSSKVISTDWYEIIYLPVKTWATVVKGTLWDSYQMHLCELRSNNHNQQIIFSQ